MATDSISQVFDLSGKGAVVTGGGSGIGKAISTRLAEAGAGVVIADINEEVARETVKEITAAGGKAQAIRADVLSTEDAKQAVESTASSFGSVDILVNNAAIYPAASVLEMSEEAWDKVLNTNLKGLFFFSQVAAQQMVSEDHGGKIINIASIEAVHPTIGHSHYDASKGGVLMVTKALALELAPHKILVNAIAPGVIWTPGLETLLPLFCEPAGLTLELLMEMTVYPRIPLGRVGESDDIAKVALFLASGFSDYMTGETLVVDGGYLLS
ncbi:SDR family NAD(P)-dependent oxidoreductase [Neptuniibacter sp.]|uniref:SDR family NAD(P)-dependent oxidoreductase n=1 Tax=Neptuniibacter sp. TaxID=1962643 RepID=UPI0026321765|nr:SDR family oxidoreductase [Neptuniibacter sp.]MCP4595993.1 SDR family oxidoreductase [Neptuniibacter sp.]